MTGTTTPDAVKLIPSGAVFFLGDEIMQLQKAGKEAAKAALMTKQVFGNDAIVVENQVHPETPGHIEQSLFDPPSHMP